MLFMGRRCIQWNKVTRVSHTTLKTYLLRFESFNKQQYFNDGAEWYKKEIRKVKWNIKW